MLLAVLPFENLGSPEDQSFADGITDEMRGDLSALAGLQVIARGSSTPYKDTAKPPQQIAHELGIEAHLRWSSSSGLNSSPPDARTGARSSKTPTEKRPAVTTVVTTGPSLAGAGRR